MKIWKFTFSKLDSGSDNSCLIANCWKSRCPGEKRTCEWFDVHGNNYNLLKEVYFPFTVFVNISFYQILYVLVVNRKIISMILIVKPCENLRKYFHKKVTKSSFYDSKVVKIIFGIFSFQVTWFQVGVTGVYIGMEWFSLRELRIFILRVAYFIPLAEMVYLYSECWFLFVPMFNF